MIVFAVLNNSQIQVIAPNAVSERNQSGRSLSYIEAWHAIAEANRIFGFSQWDRETVEMRLVQEADTIIGKGRQYEKPGFAVSYIAKVRVTVRAGDEVVIREGTQLPLSI